jgi:hypothetical protein
MEYQLYIHIGYPKTGTTFLQQQIFPKVQGLKCINIRAIDSALSKIMYQDELSFNCEQIKTEMIAHFAQGKNIISFESLIGEIFNKLINNTLIAQRLAKLFPEAKIIITIRNQYDLIESLYRQYIHEGGTKKFRDFINLKNGQFYPSYDIFDFTVNPEMFNYSNFIDYYANLFGENSILILPYELLKSNPDLFIEKLLSWIGIKKTPQFQNVNYNPGYGATQVCIARVLNRFLKSHFREDTILPEVNLPRIGKLNSQLLRAVLQSPVSFRILGRKPITDETLKTKLKNLYRASNQTLNHKYNLSLEESYYNFYF